MTSHNKFSHTLTKMVQHPCSSIPYKAEDTREFFTTLILVKDASSYGTI